MLLVSSIRPGVWSSGGSGGRGATFIVSSISVTSTISVASWGVGYERSASGVDDRLQVRIGRLSYAW